MAACAKQKPSVSPPPSLLDRKTNIADIRVIRRALTAEEAADYAGDQACKPCHSKIFEQHQSSRHAQTLSRVTVAQHGDAFRNTQKLTDAQNGYTYSTSADAQGCYLSGKGPKGQGQLKADFVWGSGKNAMTFMSRDKADAWVELRTSYYTRKKKWDYTPQQLPGQPLDRPAGLTLREEALQSCLYCHVTVLREHEDKSPDIERTSFGVGCEKCHGAGKAHIDYFRTGGSEAKLAVATMEDLGKASPDRINDICGACHRTNANASVGETHVERNLPRFQGVALARSLCYQKSNTLSCITCHNPHTDADKERTSSDKACLSCHDNTKKHEKQTSVKFCPVNRTGRCSECHMPQQRVSSIPFVRYSNHWIKVWNKSTVK